MDAILLVGQFVFVLEFKIGETLFDRSANDQVWDYALDLKNFHEASHNVSIVPILVGTEAEESPAIVFHADPDCGYRPIPTLARGLRKVPDSAVEIVTGSPLDAGQWAGAPYHPTPTGVEAARALYAQHSVDAIARYPIALTRNLEVVAAIRACASRQSVETRR